MAHIEAGPHLRASRAFGRVEGLRALAAVAFAVSVAAFTLPQARTAVGSLGSAQILVAAVAALAGFALVFQSAVAVRAIAHGHRTTGSRVPWALLTMACGLGVAAVIPLRGLAAAGRVPRGGAGDVIAPLLLGAAGVTLFLLGFGALRRRRQLTHASDSSGDPSAALPTMPVPLGRLREAPYGAAHALLATAVAVFFALVGCLRLASFGYSYSAWQTSESGARTEMGSAYAASVLLVLEIVLLALVWRRRQPRLTMTRPAPTSDGPALATVAVGFLVLLMIPVWMRVAGGYADGGHKESLFLASMALTGILFVGLGASRLRATDVPSLRTHGLVLATEPGAHTHGLATPGVAFEALRERPMPGYSFSGIRRLADLPQPRPVGFSLTRSPDGTLTPPALGLFLLGTVSLLAGLPALVLVLRTLL